MDQQVAPVLIAGEWRASDAEGMFMAENPAAGTAIPMDYPVSSRSEVLLALQSAQDAAVALERAEPAGVGRFLERMAKGIEARVEDLVECAHIETGLPKTPRLKDGELPRTVDQLRQAAAAARNRSWRRPVRDVARGIYAARAPLGGAVVVFGPNNFPFAFNSAAGGDMASAVAAHNPVIAKANTGHPGTTRIFAEIAREAASAAGLHPATLQMIYRTSRDTGFELVAHRLTGATAFTGSREAGMQLKAAADVAGKPIYLEMSSINPLVILPGALRERAEKLAQEFFSSCTMSSGQFCTNPGFVLLPPGDDAQRFVSAAQKLFCGSEGGILLGKGVLQNLVKAVAGLREAGAQLLCGGNPAPGAGYTFQNTLLSVTAGQFLAKPAELQAEAFGPVSLIVTAGSIEQMQQVLESLEGNLTGCFYSHSGTEDEGDYATLEPVLRRRVGRLLNDKMPTGVTVSPAMNHGGPFPATGHPGFTAVGIPASIERFTALHCYDGVRADRVPAWLRGQ